jgi:ABC-type transport system involved in multi-copper enzyme maturation permease subunit
MLTWKLWFDLRMRFYMSLAVLLLVVVLVIAGHSFLMGFVGQMDLAKIDMTLFPKQMRQEFQRLMTDYIFYIDSQWFKKNALSILSIMAILFALGGIQTERKKGSLLLTLSLPVERWRWIAMQAGISALLLLISTVISTMGILAGSLFIGKQYPVETALLQVLLVWLGCLQWIGLSVFLNSYLHSSLKSAFILIPLQIIWSSLVIFPALYRYSALRLADLAVWRTGIPWEALLVALVLALGGTAFAAWRFEQYEA